MKIYQAINAVQGDLSKVGLAKDRTAGTGGGASFRFRGIDDVYNVIAPLLAKHGLCILPRVLSRECVERKTAKGTVLYIVTVDVEFDFVCAEDGSKHTIKTYGEAMDSGDKATNKAMSAAYKYAALQAFSIPTEGDNDADAHQYGGVDQSTGEILPAFDTAGALDKVAMQTSPESLKELWKKLANEARTAHATGAHAAIKAAVMAKNKELTEGAEA